MTSQPDKKAEIPTPDVSVAPIGETLESLPPRPGVYLMKDDKGKILYVGKATNLRTRVRSYFRESSDSRLNVRFLKTRVATVDVIVTETEKEALLLENILIKKHLPRYNIRLRDDKTYLSLRLDTSHEWPRVHPIRRRRAGDKALYFGPFSSSSSMKQTMRFLQRLFPLRSCPDHVLNNRSRPCILHQIDRCCAPCVGLVDKEKYDDYVDQTILFLNGRKEEVIDLLRRKMWEYSEDLAYEKAAAVRDRLRAIEKTVEREDVASHRRFDRDVIAFTREAGHVVFMHLAFREGDLVETTPHHFRDHGVPDEELLESFLGQFYTTSDIPRDIVVSMEPANVEMLRATLAELRDGALRIIAPQRGEKRRLVEMALRNARQELERRLAGEQSRQAVLESLQKKLRLDRPPRRIDCFDISTFQGAFTVGSMTCFIDGDPDKSQYRRFKVRSIAGQDDFGAMREVLTRRYSRVLKEDEEDLPDLVVIDGGKGQLNIALEVFRELGMLGRVPVCGLAKARVLASKQGPRLANRSEERVFLPLRKDPIRFDQSDPALFILTRIRDEAHRFGITYHRKLRNTASLRSGLEEIPGVGPKRRKVLLTHFGSLTRIRSATVEELSGAPGITMELARIIHQFLHGSSGEEPTTGEEAEVLYSDEGEEDGEEN
ncbi:MAG: excinuclease ABC subunit UvrC [Candidatus Sumerlaeia bacterium]|nr:excinuclease ABC subunit UvrC [Candidatus Sumerlaeia bacterium]